MSMNRKQRRQLKREGKICEHGHIKKTDGNGDPMCLQGCGFRKPGMVTYEELHAFGSHDTQIF